MGDTFRSHTAEVEELQVCYEGKEIWRVTTTEAGAVALPSNNLQETDLTKSNIQHSKEVVPATLRYSKTIRRWQRMNRMAANIILKSHLEAVPTLGHSAKVARVISVPENKAKEPDIRVSITRTQQDTKDPSGGRETKVARDCRSYWPQYAIHKCSQNEKRTLISIVLTVTLKAEQDR
ncbi:unnamed protein product [Nezara viridula]|uniref:Uncharacterized protein n=1 Tax=Nezara viridula TaxID=85310 RepID=A0A9P0E7P5_NEZVI|nr:unnamed protein product [Nezara viridula]